MDCLKELLGQLISVPSVTPQDAGCQKLMMNYLNDLGFSCQKMNKEPVANFFACYGGHGPLLIFAGHTDVVPVGEAQLWETDPFVLVEKAGMLYGRGTADMKGSLAAMLLAAKRFVSTYPHFPGRLGFLITSGEEGDDFHLGTPYVMEQLSQQGIKPDYCILGEPSSTTKTGDMVKIGRRGSLTGKLSLQGKQGHVAYPHLAQNPIHMISPALFELTQKQWDRGNEYFPPTSLQFTYIHSGGHASNIIPGELLAHFNFRFSTEQTESSLKEQVLNIFNKYELEPAIEWRLNGEPFLTSQGKLIDSCKEAILECTGIQTQLSTTGGTSDGRFIAPYGVELIELGPCNATIHQVNECVSLEELRVLEELYFSLCVKLLS